MQYFSVILILVVLMSVKISLSILVLHGATEKVKLWLNSIDSILEIEKN